MLMATLFAWQHVCSYTLAVHALLLDKHYKFKLCCIGKLAFDWLSAWKLSPYQSVPVHIYLAFCKHEKLCSGFKARLGFIFCVFQVQSAQVWLGSEQKNWMCIVSSKIGKECDFKIGLTSDLLDYYKYWGVFSCWCSLKIEVMVLIVVPLLASSASNYSRVCQWLQFFLLNKMCNLSRWPIF